MKVVLAVVVVALSVTALALHTAPSAAQIPSISEKAKQKDGDSAARAAASAKRAEDRAYKSAVDSVPDQKADPWRNLR